MILGYKPKDAITTYKLLVNLGFREWYDNSEEPPVSEVLEMIEYGNSFFVLPSDSFERFFYCCHKASPREFKDAYMVDSLEEFLENHPKQLDLYIRSTTKLGDLL
jgi:hypothetical protein